MFILPSQKAKQHLQSANDIVRDSTSETTNTVGEMIGLIHLFPCSPDAAKYTQVDTLENMDVSEECTRMNSVLMTPSSLDGGWVEAETTDKFIKKVGVAQC